MKPFPPEPAEGKGPVKVMKKFDAETASTIITFLGAGAFIETAAAAAGISKQTLYDWLRRGKRQKRGPMFEFVAETERAMGMAEVRAIGLISKAASGGEYKRADGSTGYMPPQWQAAAWHLERKYPDRWGRRDHVEHTGPLDVSTSFRGAAREKLESAIAAAASEGEPDGEPEPDPAF
jgi:hypothetical protein